MLLSNPAHDIVKDTYHNESHGGNMKQKTKMRATLAFTLALLLCLVGVAKAAPPEENNVNDASQIGYMSLHQYVMPTSINNVYRVRLEVYTPPLKSPPIYVTFVLDSTGSMTKYCGIDPQYMDFWTDMGTVSGRPNYVSNGENYVERAIGAVYAMNRAFKALQDSASPENIYVNVFSFNNMSLTGLLDGGDGTKVDAATMGTAGSGNNFVPLLDPSNKARLNPVLTSGNTVTDITQADNLYAENPSYAGSPSAMTGYRFSDPVVRSSGVVLPAHNNITNVGGAYMSIIEGERFLSEVMNRTSGALPYFGTSALAPIYGVLLKKHNDANGGSYNFALPPTVFSSNSSNNIAAGLCGAYRDLRALKQSGNSTIDYDNANKAVLMLADGDDRSFGTTQGWALALKAPIGSPNVTILPSTETTVSFTPASSGGGYETLGASFWSVGFGLWTPHSSSWKTDYFANTTTPTSPWNSMYSLTSYWGSISNTSSLYFTEPHIATLSANVPDAAWTSLIAGYNTLAGSIPATPSGSSNISFLNDIMGLYQTALAGTMDSQFHFVTYLSNSASSTPVHANFAGYTMPPFHSSTANGGSSMLYPPPGNFSDEEEAQSVFENFAKSTLHEPSNIVSHSELQQYFTLYKFPGEPLLNATLGTATANNGVIDWKMSSLTYGGTATLTFYVEIDADANPDMYYPVVDSYMSYDRPDTSSSSSTNMLSAVKHYSPIFVSPKNGTKQDESSENPSNPNGSGSSMDLNTSDRSSSGSSDRLIPIHGLLGNDGAPYTPSVTPALKIANESLEENATSEAIPVTKSNAATVWVVLSLVVVAGITLVMSKRHRKTKN